MTAGPEVWVVEDSSSDEGSIAMETCKPSAEKPTFPEIHISTDVVAETILATPHVSNDHSMAKQQPVCSTNLRQLMQPPPIVFPKDVSSAKRRMHVSRDDNTEYEVGREELIQPDGIRGMLCRTIDSVDSSGLFAYGQSLKDAPNPNLHLKGYGVVRFPLGPDDIRMIKNASHKDLSVSGSSGEALDPAVLSKSWIVPWHEWETQNPFWTRTLQSITANICFQFGMPTDLILFPCALVLDEVSGSRNLYETTGPGSNCVVF
ncbi:uncharacterized protein LY89DRAFT_432878 [Mollisia scopiformis]|uniref:Uncharacterized protein n=1 Tax=Mollisia scopiformis TaxID=149040 RepID=A0A194XMC4_MOLSC|nr:uncharacterized protein LY89DRAFT_432878 [Mollisia scopiformis]KUJ21400.1 hypothetical protein LY89DRAFT_432878 [Mollisia scopiformis]